MLYLFGEIRTPSCFRKSKGLTELTGTANPGYG
jgi:hypothetical protein